MLARYMSFFVVKSPPLSGTNYQEIYKSAKRIFKEKKSLSKRKWYVRSAYFKKQKIFFDYFWPHLMEKNLRDRARRLKFLPCGLELIEKSMCKPDEVKTTTQTKKELYYRFSQASSGYEHTR